MTGICNDKLTLQECGSLLNGSPVAGICNDKLTLQTYGSLHNGSPVTGMCNDKLTLQECGCLLNGSPVTGICNDKHPLQACGSLHNAPPLHRARTSRSASCHRCAWHTLACTYSKLMPPPITRSGRDASGAHHDANPARESSGWPR